MKITLVFILFTVFVSVISGCFNPFFPERGTPPEIESSPERTVQLFKEAYERKDICAFEDLIYFIDDFSSYTQIPDDYTLNLSSFFLSEPKVLIDTVFMYNRFLPQNRYYYELDWKQEYRIHEKMFELSDEIVFSAPFIAGETLYEVFGPDTVSALVKTEKSQIRIKYRGEHVIDITGQIFAMKKRNGVWKIWKWIELN